MISSTSKVFGEQRGCGCAMTLHVSFSRRRARLRAARLSESVCVLCLQLARLLRVLRFIRILKSFLPMRVLVDGMEASFFSLLYAATFFIVLVYGFAVFFTTAFGTVKQGVFVDDVYGATFTGSPRQIGTSLGFGLVSVSCPSMLFQGRSRLLCCRREPAGQSAPWCML